MRTWRYHRDFPEGRIFDTEPGKPDPLVPHKSLGWVENRGDLQMTTDQVVEAAVKQELAKQDSNRIGLEKEFKKMTGEQPSSLISDKAMTRAYNETPPSKTGKR